MQALTVGTRVAPARSYDLSAPESQFVFGAILDGVLALTESALGFIAEVAEIEPVGPTLRVVALTDRSGEGPARPIGRAPTGPSVVTLRDGPYADALETGEPIISNALDTEARHLGWPAGDLRVEAFLWIPCLLDGRVIAAIGLANRSGGYREEHAELLRPLASTVGHLIGAARSEILRVAAERAHAETASTMSSVLSAMVDGVVTIDEQGRMLSVNEATARIFDYPVSELIGQNVHVLMGEPERSGHDRYLATYLAGERPPSILGQKREVIGRRRDGAPVPLELSVTETRSDDRRLFVGVLRNQTEERRLGAALGESEERLRSAMAHAQMGSWDLHIDEGRLYWSEQTGPLYGLPPGSEASVARVFELIHPQDRASTLEALAASLKARRPWELEHRVVWPDGTLRWVLLRGDLVRAPDGRPVRMLGIVQDVTRRKGLEESLVRSKEEAERASLSKSNFLSMMSHELRTPLNAILGIAGALQEGVYGAIAPRQVHAIRTIESSGRHLLDLIGDLLDIAKIESGAAGLRLEHVSVQGLMEACASLVRDQCQSRGLELRIELAPDCGVVGGDRRRLKQILLNLLSNAIKFAGAGGTVGLGARPGEDEVILSVWDNGIGIADAALRQLFRPFVQLEEWATREPSGTGLGLMLTRQLVELHGGGLRVHSRPGGGTRVEVHLPAVERAHLAATPLRVPAHGRLLVIHEHDPQGLCAYLGRLGYEIHGARTVADALLALAQSAFDVLVIELGVADAEGLSAIDRLARSAGGPRRRLIVAISTVSLQDDEAHVIAAGATAYFARPVRLATLADRLADFVGAARAEADRVMG